MCPSLQVSGKWAGQPSVAMAAGHSKNCPLFAQDCFSKRPFLVDTRAKIIMLAATMTEKLSSSQVTKLTAANGSHIRTFGTCTISLQFHKWCFQWTFTIAAVSQPLLGADFLSAHSIVADVKGQHRQGSTHPIIPPSPCTASLQQHLICTPLPLQVMSLPNFWLMFKASPPSHSPTPLPSIV